MIKFDNTEIHGWEAAIRGMRNPHQSWSKSDSEYAGVNVSIGENDLKLMKQLRMAGSDHRKFMRMINVYVDITAPLYYFKELDVYKVGTVCNSTSTMHSIHKKEFVYEDFSHEHLTVSSTEQLMRTIVHLNKLRNLYINYDIDDNGGYPKPNKKTVWYNMIQLLPSSYNQKRTYMLNYEVLFNIYHARKNHRLQEWNRFCEWIESLPYAKELICDVE